MDLTVNVATPFVPVVPWTGVMVGDPGPEDLASVTALFETTALLSSFKVTVIVEVVAPSATKLVGEAVTVELAALGT